MQTPKAKTSRAKPTLQSIETPARRSVTSSTQALFKLYLTNRNAFPLANQREKYAKDAFKVVVGALSKEERAEFGKISMYDVRLVRPMLCCKCSDDVFFTPFSFISPNPPSAVASRKRLLTHWTRHTTLLLTFPALLALAMLCCFFTTLLSSSHIIMLRGVAAIGTLLLLQSSHTSSRLRGFSLTSPTSLVHQSLGGLLPWRALQ